MSTPANYETWQTGADRRIDGLRGIAAVGVVVYHLAFLAGITSFGEEPARGFLGFLTQGMSIFLTIFFVLSGYLLFPRFARSIIDDKPMPRLLPYFWRRGLRLLPTYWIVVALTVLLLNRPILSNAWATIRPFVALQFYAPAGEGLAGLGPAWTVPTEISYYLVLPLLAFAIRPWARRGATPTERAQRLIAAIVPLTIIGLGWVYYTNHPNNFETVMAYNMWYWPTYFVDIFALGMCLGLMSAWSQVTGRLTALQRAAQNQPAAMWLIAVGLFIANCFRPLSALGTMGPVWQELLNHVLSAFCAAFLVLPLTVPHSDSRVLRAVAGNPLTVFLGSLSYGIYLWHDPITYLYYKSGSLFGTQPMAGPEVRGTHSLAELLVFVLGATICVAVVNHFVIERSMHHLRTLFDGKPETSPPAPLRPLAVERVPVRVAPRGGV